MKTFATIAQARALALALLGGIGEFAQLQLWRVRAWLLHHAG